MKRLAAIFLLLAGMAPAAFSKGDRQTLKVYDFSKGVDTYHDPSTLPDGFVQDSLNGIFDDKAPFTKRLGYTTAWTLNVSTSIVITSGVNDTLYLQYQSPPGHRINIPIAISSGSYTSASSLASVIDSAIKSYGLTTTTFTYNGSVFTWTTENHGIPLGYYSIVSDPSQVGIIGEKTGNTLGYLSREDTGNGPGIYFFKTVTIVPFLSAATASSSPQLTGLSFQNIWTYTDSTNTTWQIVRSSTAIYANNLTGSSSILIATVSANNLVGETNAFGNAYFVDQTQGVYYWTGSSSATVSGSPKGSIITQFHNRLWVTGAAPPNGNQLYGSAYYSGTNWTAGGQNDTDPVQYSVGLQDNFDNITALYVYLDTLYVFKHYATFGLYGFGQSSFQISQLTQECGCMDGNSIQTFAGGLKLVSMRGVEDFNGITCTRVSDPVKNKVDPAIVVGSYGQQSLVLQQQGDWNAGTLDQLTASGSGLVISTQAPYSTTDTAWNSGTLVSLDSTTNAPNLQLGQVSITPQTQTSQTRFQVICNVGLNPSCGGDVAQSFTTSSNAQLINSFSIYCAQANSPSATLSIKSDNSNSPGTTLVSAALNSSSCGSGSPAWSQTALSPITLSGSTKYWVYLSASGLGFNSNAIAWYYSTGNPYSGGNYWSSNTGNLTSLDFAFQEGVVSPQYETSGSFTSQVFDVGSSTNSWLWNWGAFNTSETDNGQTITYMTRTSSSASGPWDSPVPVTPGGTIGSSAKEFIQYIASFTTTNAALTPILSSVTFGTSSMERSSGTFKSHIYNIGSISSWGNFYAQDSLSGTGDSIAFSICSSTNSNMSEPVSCGNQTPNTQITISTGNYVQWFATFTVTMTTQTPSLQGGTVQWFSGSRPVPMSSTVWDNRYWLSLTTNTVDSVNNAVLVLNSRGVWSVFDIHAGGFVQSKGFLYHSDSLTSGNIYLDNQAYSDNGNPIRAFIKTKELAAGDFTADDYWYALYPSARNTGNCSMSVQYEPDKSGTAYSLDSVLLSEYSNRSSVKLPYPVDSSHQNFGQTMNWTFGTNDETCGFQFYGFEGLYKKRPVQ